MWSLLGNDSEAFVSDPALASSGDMMPEAPTSSSIIFCTATAEENSLFPIK